MSLWRGGLNMQSFIRTTWHPALFILYFCFRPISMNPDLYSLDDLVSLLIILAAAGYLLSLIISWLFRIKVSRAALLVSLCVVLICIVWYGVNAMLDTSTNSTKFVAFVVLAIFTISLFVLFDRIGNKGTVLLNIISLVLVLQSVLNYMHLIDAGENISSERIFKSANQSYFSMESVKDADLITPNIFHIVLDGYSRKDVLKSAYGFDNQSFIDKLQEKGFTVYDKARTPYNQTLFSMSSVFSGELLETKRIHNIYSNPTQLRNSLGNYLIDSPVSRWLKSLGYKIGLSSEIGYSFIHVKYEDKYYLGNVGKIEYARSLYEKTLLGAIDKKYFSNAISRIIFSLMIDGPYKYPLNYLLDTSLNNLPKPWPKAPFLLYQHILSPHPPFTIDRFGKETDKLQPKKEDAFVEISLADGSHLHHMDRALQETYIEGYIEKLIVTNGLLDTWLDMLLESLPEPYVIIIQSDHGGGAYYNQSSMKKTCVQERFGILLAIHSSDPELVAKLSRSGLESSPNSVNIYRALFNSMTGTKKEMAENISRFISWNDPFKQIEVPEQRHGDACQLD